MSNVSEEKRKKFLEYLNSLKNKTDNSDELKIIGEISQEINSKRYGLIWEEHTEIFDEELNENIPSFVECKKIISKKNSENLNFLLEGDNLHSLYLLLKSKRGQIDVIYIDPPYNTGSQDFKYNDQFVDSEDNFRHSKWLSFMQRRLIIAKDLLKDDGYIAISINNNELANLKSLCDEIFNENNFVSTLIWAKNNAQNDAKYIQENHEYILVYAKNKENLVFRKEKILLNAEEDRFFSIIMGNIKSGWLNNRPKMGQTIYYNEEKDDMQIRVDYDIEKAKTSNDENFVYKDDENLINQGYIKIRPPKFQDKLGRWKWSPEKMEKEKNKLFVFKTKTGGYTIKYKDMRTERESADKSIINSFSSSLGSKRLHQLGLHFDNSKPVELIEKIIKYHPDNNCTVLDFFAGSGTTGEAVLNLNNSLDYKGNRKFILCTNNENNICESITYPRLEKLNDVFDFNLNYFKTTLISKNQDLVEITKKINQHVQTLIKLENMKEIDNYSIAVVFKENQLNKTIEKVNENATIYVSPEAAIFNKLQKENIRNKNIKIEIIPSCYFSDEDLM